VSAGQGHDIPCAPLKPSTCLTAGFRPTQGRFVHGIGARIAHFTSSQQPSTRRHKGVARVSWTRTLPAPFNAFGIHGRLVEPIVFFDGFESGATARWSSEQP